MKQILFAFFLFYLVLNLHSQQNVDSVEQWTTYEISLESNKNYDNPYTDVEVWAVFTNKKGDTLKRPAFWDGGTTWKLRFAPIDNNGNWQWKSFSSNSKDSGLHGQQGSFKSSVYKGSNGLLKEGLLRMSKGLRNVEHQSGKSFLVVADTPWAIPFRATKEQVYTYAKNRQDKGFNASLMMTVQPDTKAEGPNKRNTEQGFKRAFEDLANGHINKIDVAYFQYYDEIIAILLAHELVPVYQPVFHGFGWKGLQVLGTNIDPSEYVRYTKYLLARYGSMPAFWLIAGDHDAKDPGVKESGMMLQEWDAYQQPTGLHYNPCDDYIAEWAKNDPSKHCLHYNKSHQEAEWLDFQWTQTGHNNEHLYHKVEQMYTNLPIKAIANGEPTYEGMNAGKNGLGWWQGEEAWLQMMHGGTMGVIYGAASLWQWKVSPSETGWGSWTDQPLSWEGALKLEGSTYVGLIGKIMKDIPVRDIEKRWDLSEGKPLLAKTDKLYISYLNNGGEIKIKGVPSTLNYSWINPKTGIPRRIGKVTSEEFTAPDSNPWVLLIK